LLERQEFAKIMKTLKHIRPSAGKKRAQLFRITIFVIALLAVGMITVIARYHSSQIVPRATGAEGVRTTEPAATLVTIDVRGRKLQLNAQVLQQGPLTQEQAQQLAAALKDNKSTDGLVQVQKPDGTVSMNLQGRFQNVMLAKKNDDGSLSQACVNNSAAAVNFLQSNDATKQGEQGPERKVTVRQ